MPGQITWYGTQTTPVIATEVLSGVRYAPGPVISTAWQKFTRVSDGITRVVYFPMRPPRLAPGQKTRAHLVAEAFQRPRNLKHERSYQQLFDPQESPCET